MLLEHLVGSGNKASPLSKDFSSLLSWICQTGTSPGVAVSTPTSATQRKWREVLIKCCMNWRVSTGMPPWPGGDNRSLPSPESVWDTWAVSSAQRPSCADSRSYRPCRSCCLCSMLPSQVPMPAVLWRACHVWCKPSWSRKTEITQELPEETRVFTASFIGELFVSGRISVW